MKTHYDLLSVDPSSDIETIKKAFRREIAKYHPDKVTHLGAEFQEMASTRAAELTAAYKTLSDPQARAQYDEGLKDPRAPVSEPPRPESASVESVDAVTREPERVQEPPFTPSWRFDEDRAGKDDIVRRATLARVKQSLQHVVGDCDFRAVRGFDLACVPRSKPVTSRTLSQFFKKLITPVVLVRIVPLVDAAVALEAFQDALRSRLGTKDKPVALLLIGQLAPAGELARAIDEARKKSPASLETIFPVPVDLRDWSAKMPLNAPVAVKTLIERFKTAV